MHVEKIGFFQRREKNVVKKLSELPNRGAGCSLRVSRASFFLTFGDLPPDVGPEFFDHQG